MKGKQMQPHIDNTTVAKAIAAVPLVTEPEKKRLIQAQVNLDLWNAVEATLKERKCNIRTAMEFGLRVFLAAHNPELATQLGIKPKK